MDAAKKRHVKVIKCQNGSAYNRMDLGEDVWAGLAHACLMESGFRTSVEDHCFAYFDGHEDLRSVAESTVAEEPDVVLFPIRQNTSNLHFSLRFVDLLRARGLRSTIGLFGDTGVDLDASLLDHQVDFVVVGEEPTLVRAVESIERGADLMSCPGLAIRQGGAVKLTGAALLADLDRLPFMTRYGLELGLVPPKRRLFYKANLLGSRGCYARCSFCHETGRAGILPGYSWRGRSPGNVVAEMQEVQERYAVQDFFFQDSNFFGPGAAGLDRVLDLCERLERMNSNCRFVINTRVNDVEAGVFTRLRDVGLDGAFLGVETFVERRLQRYHKGITPSQIWQAVDVLASLGITLRVGIILFDHDSTPEEVLYDLEQLTRLTTMHPGLIKNPNFLLNILAPKQGTPFADAYLAEHPADAAQIKYQHPEHLRVMQLRFAPHIIRIEDPRVSALAEVMRLLGYEIMLQWTERQEEIAWATLDKGANGDALATAAGRWTDGVFAFAAGLCVRLARHACVPLGQFDATTFVAAGYDFVFRNFLAYNQKHLGDRGLYLYTPTTDCTPKLLPAWMRRGKREDWRSWKAGFGGLGPMIPAL